MKEEESWRDLEMCVSPKVGGGGRAPSAPSLESGGVSTPLPPLFLCLCDWLSNEVCVELCCVYLFV